MDLACIIDNSLQASYLQRLSVENKKISYVHKSENLGIGKALNLGAKIAIEKGCSYLLTMDQDSSFEEGELEKLIDTAQELDEKKIKWGILSPTHKHGKYKKTESTEDFKEIPYVMTSGNLLNLEAYQEVGEFREDYFIDQVDHEYCLRTRKKGYKVFIHSNIYLVHELGICQEKYLLGKKVRFISHKPWRLYYVVRNGIFTVLLYPSFFSSFAKILLKTCLKAVFLEGSKRQRVYYILQGFKDALLKKSGKLKNKNI